MTTPDPATPPERACATCGHDVGDHGPVSPARCLHRGEPERDWPQGRSDCACAGYSSASQNGNGTDREPLRGDQTTAAPAPSAHWTENMPDRAVSLLAVVRAIRHANSGPEAIAAVTALRAVDELVRAEVPPLVSSPSDAWQAVVHAARRRVAFEVHGVRYIPMPPSNDLAGEPEVSQYVGSDALEGTWRVATTSAYMAAAAQGIPTRDVQVGKPLEPGSQRWQEVLR